MDGRGYDESRFIDRVRRELICCICLCVLKDPRLCENEEHQFCFGCISQHLPNSPTCPECRQHLTPETLKHPQRFLKNCLSELKIKCDYIERGCPEHVQLGNLQDHANHCGFSPVACENCEMQINKKDKDNHKKSFCQLGSAKCQDCGEIKATQEEMKLELNRMKTRQVEMNEKQNEIEEIQNFREQELNEMEEIQNLQRQELNEIVNCQGELHNFTNTKLDGMEADQDEMRGQTTGMKRKHDKMNVKVKKMKNNVDEMKYSQAEMKIQTTEMERKQDQINVKVNQMEENVEEIKQTQAEMKADHVMFKAEVRQQFKKVSEMLNQLLQGSNFNNNGAIDPAVPANNQDIIILGGRYGPGMDEISNTVQKFNIAEGKSTQLPQLNHRRAAAASCVYNNDVIVAGGFDGHVRTDSIEVLRWTMLDGKLPAKLSAHVAIVYEDKLCVIGGYNGNEASDAIYEMSLKQPYTSKLLERMPQPRRNHRADLVNGKLFILGGSTTGFAKEAIASCVVYDFLKNECKPCASLPQPVFGMSTVTWGNMIIVIGGKDKNGQVLNDVIMYDTETGRTTKLPSMIHKRRGCSAVIMNDVIAVCGGYNDEQGYLDSIECFTMGSDGWRELPGMKDKRHLATAIVKPHN